MFIYSSSYPDNSSDYHNIDKTKKDKIYDAGFKVDGFEFNYIIISDKIEIKFVYPTNGWFKLGMTHKDKKEQFNIITGFFEENKYILFDCFIQYKNNTTFFDVEFRGTDDISDSSGYQENGKSYIFLQYL